MRSLILGVLLVAAVTSANVLKFESRAEPGLDVHFANHHVRARSAQPEPLDFEFIKQRFHALNHNIVKRSPRGFKSKGSSKSKGSGSGFFSSKAKGGDHGSNHNNYNNHHASAPQQPAYNPNYGHAAPNYGHPSGHGQPGYHAPGGYNPGPGYHAPAPGYGQPAYHPQPGYHAPAPAPAPVVIVHSGGGGGGGGYQPAMKGPGLGTAIATGLAQGAGSGVGFGVANAAINSLTGGGHRSSSYDDRQQPSQNTNNNNAPSNNNNNVPAQNNDNYNSQANPECLKTCYSTEDYAPVCGTDGWDYTNIGKLNCMKTCGKRVEVARYGNCYVAPPASYANPAVGGNPPPAQPVPPQPQVAPVAPVAVPPPPPNTPVQSPEPLATGKGLPPGVESPEGPSGLLTGSPLDATTTNAPSTTS